MAHLYLYLDLDLYLYLDLDLCVIHQLACWLAGWWAYPLDCWSIDGDSDPFVKRANSLKEEEIENKKNKNNKNKKKKKRKERKECPKSAARRQRRRCTLLPTSSMVFAIAIWTVSAPRTLAELRYGGDKDSAPRQSLVAKKRKRRLITTRAL